MALTKSPQTLRLGAVFSALALVSLAHGEKVRFGPEQSGDIATRPVRSIRDSIEVQVSPVPNQSAPASAPAPAPTVTRVNVAESEDQRNWIFRDVRSSDGVKKALGVETYEDQAAAINERDSVAVIQDYFSRERSRSVGVTAANGAASGLNGGGGNNSTASGVTGLPTQTGPTSSSASSFAFGQENSSSTRHFGESSFPNTINSDNPAMRRYFRDLYTSQSSASSPASTLNTGSGLPGSPFTTAAPANTPTSSSFDELRQRAALVNSLSKPQDNTPSIQSRFAPINQQSPSANDNGLPTVNEGKLFERRNGLIEIPSRRF